MESKKYKSQVFKRIGYEVVRVQPIKPDVQGETHGPQDSKIIAPNDRDMKLLKLKGIA